MPDRAALEDLAIEVIRASAALGGTLPAQTRLGVVDLLRITNSYYSNRIEGNNTHPAEISARCARSTRRTHQFEPDSGKRLHTWKCELKVETWLREDPHLNPLDPSFIKRVHKEFYDWVPAELRFVRHPDDPDRTEPVYPGVFRDFDVRVGQHVPVPYGEVEQFLGILADAYDPESLSALDRVLAFAASHHRLLWVHPFGDGNGRVARLVSDAYAVRADLSSHGLWTVSRGLARKRDSYMGALETADNPRRFDADGRGNLSREALTAFCRFFLETSLDQVQFMGRLLDLERLGDRLMAYARGRAIGLIPNPAADRGSSPNLPDEAGLLLRATMFRGMLPRGEAARVMGLPTLSARVVLRELVRERLLVSDGPRMPVRLGFPDHAVRHFFPELYPEGISDEMHVVLPGLVTRAFGTVG